ncbi:MAG: ABC transporter ATP-binding protein [Pseudohongiellaceae bacterium]
MTTIVEAKGLAKHYGKFAALNGVDLNIQAGAITGLIGPNGAGKTTTLKAFTGLCDFEGELSVAGRDPRNGRHKLMEEVCFIADVGILPKWMKVRDVIDYVAGVHPRFDRNKAEHFLATTQIQTGSKIKTLSKGMVTQLHLALVMAIDVKLLVLDEPTLGLDIIYRKEFYDRLLNDYFDGNRTVIISTHQVEEIETLLTQLVFINKGRIALDVQMADLPNHYTEVLVESKNIERAEQLGPIHRRSVLGKKTFIYENVQRELLETLGELYTPSVSDLFVAKLKGETANE